MSGGRPPGPKRLAAMEQLAKMREAKLPDNEIRQALIESGLTGQQARELVPMEPSKPAPVAVLDSEDKAAIIEGAVHFLNSIATRLTPTIIDRFPDTLGPMNRDALTWSRKLKGAL